jgi:ABC-type transport system substrate-binding protein
MKKVMVIALLGTLFLGTAAFAADAVDGSWKLNVAKSKFSGTAPTSGTRAYSEGADGTTLDQKMVGADGKEASMRVTLAYDGKVHPISGNPDADAGTGKAINARISNFTLTKDGKTTGTVHRVVSADGKTLTVHNKGTHADGTRYDDRLVFDKQ